MYDTSERSASMVHQSHPYSTILTRVALIVLALLVIIGSVVFISYAAVLHPKELKVQATAVVQTILTNQAQSTAINTPQSLYTQVTSNPPTLNYSSDSAMIDWNTGNQGDDSCLFTNGAYHVHVASDQDSFFCLDEGGGSYSNFALQAQMTILNGTIGGLRFRVDEQGQAGYVFTISSNGIYSISVVQNNPSATQMLLYGRSTFVHQGSQQPNLLTVIARGKHFLYYINKQFIGSIDDNKLGTGLISLYAANLIHRTGNDVAFTNIQLWNL